METRSAGRGGWWAPFVILASIAAPTWIPPKAAGQVVQKESKMQSGTNPQDPGKPVSPRVLEMVGATNEPFYLGPEPVEANLAIHVPTGPAALHEEHGQQIAQREIFLYIENFTCMKPAPPFRVYLNVPRGDIPERHPELYAGNLGTFGLVQASDPKKAKGGNGLSFTLEITDNVVRLATAKNWDPTNLRVSFTPGFWEGTVPQVKVGRVSLYYK